MNWIDSEYLVLDLEMLISVRNMLHRITAAMVRQLVIYMQRLQNNTLPKENTSTCSKYYKQSRSILINYDRNDLEVRDSLNSRTSLN